ENLQVFIASLGAWGPVAFLIASAASVVFPVVPAGLLVIAGPVLFGPIQGTILNYVAVCAGSLLNFAIARHVGLGLIERLFRPRTVERFLGWTRSGRFARAFALRSEEHTSELQSRFDLVCRPLLEKKKRRDASRREPGQHVAT